MGGLAAHIDTLSGSFVKRHSTNAYILHPSQRDEFGIRMRRTKLSRRTELLFSKINDKLIRS